MSRHRNLRAEVEGSEYFEDPSWEDDNYEDDFIERRIDMNDAWHYTKAEFMACYGGTFQWDAAKVWKHPATKRAEEKAAKKAKDKAKKNEAAAVAVATAATAATAAAAEGEFQAAAAAPAPALAAACGVCTFVNPTHRTKCELCDAPLAQAAATLSAPAAAASPAAAAAALAPPAAAPAAAAALAPLVPSAAAAVPALAAPVLSLDDPGLAEDPGVAAALRWGGVEDWGFVARELAAEGVDLDLLLDASRLIALQLILHAAFDRLYQHSYLRERERKTISAER
jgi:hypothetical protein